MPRSHLLALLCVTCLLSFTTRAEEFDFDLAALEKKPFEWRGFAELRYEGIDLNQESILYPPSYPNGEEVEQRWSGALELSGDYRRGDTRLSATWHGQGQDDTQGSTSQGSLYEAYLNQQFNLNLNGELGKRTMKWGKGYAWSPVAFVERPKDPTDPELSREGFVLATADWVKSGSGALQMVGITPVILPVTEDINDDYGQIESTNLAGKLYLLYQDIDIDFMFLGNGTHPGRIGADFSFNPATHIELHGEWVYIPDYPKKIVQGGQFVTDEQDGHSILLGMRYLTATDTTWFIELFHQSHGYSQAEMQDFFNYLTASPTPSTARDLGQQAGFLRFNPMRNYLYLRVNQKDPFDWLYSSLGLTVIANLEDSSFMLMPAFTYTAIEDLELRLRLNLLEGESFSEYGEKLNENKLELRVRYFF